MTFRTCLACFLLASAALAAETDALAISTNIRARHVPFGTILDPFLDAQNNVTGYTRCGDSAIWTGHYLAAESFRYRVTLDPAARDNMINAITGIQNLIDVTGENLLARCFFPKSWPMGPGILREEASHGAYEGTCLGQPCHWIGNTSRDQYVGVFFGLNVAYQMANSDTWIRTQAAALVTRMLDRLDKDAWSVRMPDGSISTSFALRGDQKLALLAVGARVNPGRFSSAYRTARFWESAFVGIPIAAEVLDTHHSYFKFNIDVLAHYLLATYESSSLYRGRYTDAYGLLRRTLDDHGNAHFNMIDRAIRGTADSQRDGETRRLLDAWLTRPRRDDFVDWRESYPSCFADDRACDPIPIERRVRTDFLWQRSPFLLFGGGAGNIEGAGIDYILPYWMARFYGII